MTQIKNLQADKKLNDVMPVIGFGTWEITGKSCIKSVSDALHMGYRHIDTAQMYGNEKEVGKGIKASKIDRESVFVTTKIATDNLKPELIKKTTDESLSRLDMEYVDLLLIHWPVSGMDLNACLDTMFELQDKDKVKHVGVSNFKPDLFKKALNIGDILTNQVKFSPHTGQEENLKIARENDCIITAYSPLERGDIVKDKKLKQIAEKYKKTVAQVSLRWLIQLGNVSVIPKAESEDHRKTNLEIFDFELSEEDIKTIDEA